jgi:hypothetical protein
VCARARVLLELRATDCCRPDAVNPLAKYKLVFLGDQSVGKTSASFCCNADALSDTFVRACVRACVRVARVRVARFHRHAGIITRFMYDTFDNTYQVNDAHALRRGAAQKSLSSRLQIPSDTKTVVTRGARCSLRRRLASTFYRKRCTWKIEPCDCSEFRPLRCSLFVVL